MGPVQELPANLRNEKESEQDADGDDEQIVRSPSEQRRKQSRRPIRGSWRAGVAVAGEEACRFPEEGSDCLMHFAPGELLPARVVGSPGFPKIVQWANRVSYVSPAPQELHEGARR
jgi:hypothetical protein